MKSWGSRVDLADELERELSLSHESARDENEPLDYDDVISLTSSDPAASALLGYNPDEQEMAEDEDVQTESSQISCPAYEELLEVMERATARLDLQLVPLPRLRVGVEEGTDQKEVGKTWGRWSRRDVLKERSRPDQSN